MRQLAPLVCLVCASSAWAQGTTYFPDIASHATLMFEDEWPSRGDYDFNDLVLRLRVQRNDTVTVVTGLKYDFNVHALGASYCSGLALRLPIDPGDLEVTRAAGTAGGGAWVETSLVPVSDGAGGAVITVANDVRQELCDDQEGFLNTEVGSTTASCRPVSIRIQVDPAAAGLTEPGATDPGDVFLFRCGEPDLQVHRSRYYGVPGGPFAVDPSRFLTADDNSEVHPTTKAPTGTRFYVDAAGVPAAILLGDGVSNHPAERQRLDQVFTDVVAFAQGTGGTDFWHTPDGNAFAYTGGSPGLFEADFEPTACAEGPHGTWTGLCDCTIDRDWSFDGIDGTCTWVEHVALNDETFPASTSPINQGWSVNHVTGWSNGFDGGHLHLHNFVGATSTKVLSGLVPGRRYQLEFVHSYSQGYASISALGEIGTASVAMLTQHHYDPSSASTPPTGRPIRALQVFTAPASGRVQLIFQNATPGGVPTDFGVNHIDVRTTPELMLPDVALDDPFYTSNEAVFAGGWDVNHNTPYTNSAGASPGNLHLHNYSGARAWQDFVVVGGATYELSFTKWYSAGEVHVFALDPYNASFVGSALAGGSLPAGDNYPDSFLFVAPANGLIRVRFQTATIVDFGVSALHIASVP